MPLLEKPHGKHNAPLGLLMGLSTLHETKGEFPCEYKGSRGKSSGKSHRVTGEVQLTPWEVLWDAMESATHPMGSTIHSVGSF